VSLPVLRVVAGAIVAVTIASLLLLCSPLHGHRHYFCWPHFASSLLVLLLPLHHHH
jgi:hypothetical protein